MQRFASSEWGPALAGLLLLVVLVGLLELLSISNLLSPFTVPPPSDILASVPGLFTDEHLVRLFVTTFGVILAATALCVVIGIPLGLLLYVKRDLGRAYETWLGAAFSAPIILLYPLFLVVMGRGLHTVAVMSFIAGVSPVILSTYRGLRGIPEVYLRVAKSFNMPQRDVYWKVLLPSALPSIFTGIRLTLIYVMINVVAIEFLMAIGGLGFLVGHLYDRYDIPGMYAAVLFVILASVLFFYAIDKGEKWLKRL